jgi:hypothetical protein
LLQNSIEFESLCAEGRESEKADIRLHNNGALQSDPRGKHKQEHKTRLNPAKRSLGSTSRVLKSIRVRKGAPRLGIVEG